MKSRKTVTDMESIVDKVKVAFRSKRLVYRAIENTAEDKEFIYEQLQKDPVTTALGSPVLLRPETRAKSDEDVESVVKSSLLAVMICLPPKDNHDKSSEPKSTTNLGSPKEHEDASPIGCLTLSKQRMDSTVHWRWTRLGIQIAEPFQGHGYGPEAINWAVDWAFTWAGMHRVELGTVSYNTRAADLYRKLGFVQEGVRRGVIYMNRNWHDLIEFGLLEEEWEARQTSRIEEDSDNN